MSENWELVDCKKIRGIRYLLLTRTNGERIIVELGSLWYFFLPTIRIFKNFKFNSYIVPKNADINGMVYKEVDKQSSYLIYIFSTLAVTFGVSFIYSGLDNISNFTNDVSKQIMSETSVGPFLLSILFSVFLKYILYLIGGVGKKRGSFFENYKYEKKNVEVKIKKPIQTASKFILFFMAMILLASTFYSYSEYDIFLIGSWIAITGIVSYLIDENSIVYLKDDNYIWTKEKKKEHNKYIFKKFIIILLLLLIPIIFVIGGVLSEKYGTDSKLYKISIILFLLNVLVVIVVYLSILIKWLLNKKF
ncbi:hypothetical protein BG262_05810 [Floricoccus penangensis]|uniref:DUF443 family protein n=1 Tax=Floricoccus penangensis TaxID=1859475 RepID=A0A9Q5NZ23_9LACT|nr:hypothetical protein [Floricoccus penangensis]OFI45999.1 hypothetical protein BG262_05810 [Floricoccus penangensis]